MKNIGKYVKLGASLGKVLLGKAQGEDDHRVSRWLTKSKRASRVVADTIDQQKLEQRRDIYQNCDPTAAWDSVARRRIARDDRSKRSLVSGNALRWAAATIFVAALITAGTVLISSQHRRVAALRTISEMRPTGAMAMLYRADGQAVELTAKSSGLVLDGLQVGENSIEYGKMKSSKPNMMDELVIPRGCEYSLTLVDGTKVWLNSSSRLRYFTEVQEQTRLVYAEGEIYFDVTHDAEHPFVVISGKQRIEVLGTKFNLNSYTSDICTTLIDGNIALSRADMTDRVTMSAGQQSSFDATEDRDIEVRNVDVDKYTAWREGIFVFEQATIDEIMESLARWYDFNYEISPRVRSLRFSGQFPRYEELDKIISIILSTGSGIDINLDGSTIKLT